MPERDDERSVFLASAGWGSAAIESLAGDASLRRYFRLKRGAETAILMDAPPETNTTNEAFVSVARHLARRGLSSPGVRAFDFESGFVLLEDLGDDLFSAVLDRAPQSGKLLYGRAVDVLIELARQPGPAELPKYDTTHMVDLAALPYEWYAPGPSDGFRTAMRNALEPLTATRQTIALRDYHVDNLIWMPDREGVRSVGLLDFQDAALCHPAYDLMSLLRDVRREVPKDIVEQEQARFCTILGLEPRAFDDACRVLSIQRNMRILGVFARLSKRDGKTRYVDYLPRVWTLLTEDLGHPDVEDLNTIISDTLPAPTATLLNALR